MQIDIYEMIEDIIDDGDNFLYCNFCKSYSRIACDGFCYRLTSEGLSYVMCRDCFDDGAGDGIGQ